MKLKLATKGFMSQ